MTMLIDRQETPLAMQCIAYITMQENTYLKVFKAQVKPSVVRQ